uniref:7TM GPCR serpentine receptor class x (Srx) domain-containing protein n=1 Tax=Panagrolaimus sp. JU765 TaxID=591449 RepID=A0AC34QSX9_9BILA
MYSGVITVFNTKIDLQLEQFFGGLANAAWISMIPQALVLSMNRLIVIKNGTSKSKTNTIIFMFLLFCCWIFGGTFFVLYMTNLTGIIFDNENFYWFYDDGSWSPIVGTLEYYTTIPILILTFVVYVIIVGFIFFMIFIRYKDYRSSITYRIMLSIGITDCLQLISHMYSGVITVFNTKIDLQLEQFFGGLANAAWISMIPQALVLSMNRLIVIKNGTSKSKTNTIIFMFLLFCCWIFGGTFFVLYMTNLTGIIFDNENFYWFYDDGSWSPIVGTLEYYTTIPILILTFVVYVIIVGFIFFMRMRAKN